MAERRWVMPLLYLAVGFCAVGTGVWLHRNHIAVELGLPAPRADGPVETQPALPTRVSFDGKTVELYYTDPELPGGLCIGFEMSEQTDTEGTPRREYLLQIRDGEVSKGIELAAGWFHYLVDVTGDGREELIVGEPELPEQLCGGLRRVQIHEVRDLDSASGQHILGPRLLQVVRLWRRYDVYALGEDMRQLGWAGKRGPTMACTDSAHGAVEGPTRAWLASITAHDQTWADPYGTGVPVYCKTEVESELWRTEEDGREYVIVKRLVATWEFDRGSDTFAWVKRHVLIPGEGKKLTPDDLQGILRP
ncbi:MAG: hypothetical protein GY842_25575 [bacterium]|nr:hypothetical protein [bacterium]